MPADPPPSRSATDIAELKQAEQALRESESRTRILLQAADVGLWDWNLLTNEVYFSPEWKGQIGYLDDEVPNTFAGWESRLHPDDHAATLAAIQEFREGRRPIYDVEFRLRHKDGTWRWIFARANFVRSAEGMPVRMMGSHTDITDRKLASEALAASEQRFKYVLDATNEGIWDMNIATGAVYFSPQWARLLGYEPGEIPQHVDFFHGIVHPEDTARVSHHIQEHLAGRTPIKQDEIRLRTKAGSYRWFLDRAKVVARNAAGAPMRMVGTITDITDRHHYEGALVASETMLRAIVNASPVPMALNDAQQNITFINPAFVDTFGYAQSEIPTFAAWLTKAYPNPTYLAKFTGDWQAELLRVQHTGAAFTAMEVSVRCKDGSTKTVLATASTLSRSLSAEHLVVMYDITPQKMAQTELSASLLEKNALLKEVHHRVKNNLQVITSLLRLERHRSTVDQAKAVLGDMQARIRAMALLHESLYRTGTFASVDLSSYLRELSTQSFRTQETSGGAIQLALNLGSMQVSMDQAVSCGLLINELISNCLKHAFPEGAKGQVRIELQPSETAPQWRLCVSDTGVGLPPDFDERRQRSLGLQLVADLARQLNGELSITSNQNGGSAFSVNFQVIEPAPLVMPA